MNESNCICQFVWSSICPPPFSSSKSFPIDHPKAHMFLPLFRLVPIPSFPHYCSSAVLFLLLNIRSAITNQPNESVFTSTQPPAGASSVRFLHFSVWALPNWWLRSSNSSRVLAVIESFGSDPLELDDNDQQREESHGHFDSETKHWQMVLWLFTNSAKQRMPYIALVNAGKQIQLKNISECEPNAEEKKKRQKRVEVEIELFFDRLFVRAKNAVRYPIPKENDGPELRVYFVGNDQRNGHLCQLKSEMEFKETSKFALPPTTPIVPTLRMPISPYFALPFPSVDSPISQILPSIVRIDHKWPYSRKRAKIPRRGTMSAQRLLTPSHYVSPSSATPLLNHRQPITMNSLHNFGEKGPKEETEETRSTATTYIDILRDRRLYEEVQRSRTNELNSRWSTTFFVFMLLIAFLISSTAAFALLVSVLLQRRPKSPKHCHNSPIFATFLRQ